MTPSTADEQGFTLVTPSERRYWAFLQPGSILGARRIKFVPLAELESDEVEEVDPLLALVLGRAFVDLKAETVVLEGDEPGASLLFKGLGDIGRDGRGPTQCVVSKQRYFDLRSE